MLSDGGASAKPEQKEAATTMKVYISGPMTGYPELNFPAFHTKAAELRSQGYTVISPAEVESPVKSWEGFMREDIKVLLDCDTVAVLPNWDKSKGARIEVFLGSQLGMEIVDADTLEPIEVNFDLIYQHSELIKA